MTSNGNHQQRDLLSAAPSNLPLLQPMTKGEREELKSLVRQRAKVARSLAAQRAAELRSDFERQLDASYSYDQDAIWQESYKVAKQVADEAQERVHARCRELGIPDEFAPKIVMGWARQGQQATKERRGELRKIAHVQIEAIEKAARTEIERASVDVQTELVAHGLTSEAAKQFLAKMPAVETLMPSLSIEQIEMMNSQRRLTSDQFRI
jgi:hypothetical protein